jgi:hypothetical protein
MQCWQPGAQLVGQPLPPGECTGVPPETFGVWTTFVTRTLRSDCDVSTNPTSTPLSGEVEPLLHEATDTRVLSAVRLGRSPPGFREIAPPLAQKTSRYLPARAGLATVSSRGFVQLDMEGGPTVTVTVFAPPSA